MESPASALRRHRSEVRRLLRVGFTHYARLKTAHAAWRDTGRGTCGFPFVTRRRAAHRWCNTPERAATTACGPVDVSPSLSFASRFVPSSY